MTRTALAALLLAAAPAAAAERSYPVADFDRVQVEGPYEVVLVTGAASSARATGSEAALERVTIEVQSGVLKIHPNRSGWGGYPGANAGPVRIAASTRQLRAATVIGAGTLAIDRLAGLRADLSVSGSGRIAVRRVEADTLMLGLIGSGRIGAAGAAKQVRATIQGSGDLDAASLFADDLVLNAETAGTVAIAARRSARVKAGGSGNVEVSGLAACTVTATGAGQVRCGRS
jgi:Putative auto-transporter adhesin, head GIN domain